ncbi:hypothetical protein Bca101_058565 [Brassica carinata]
MISKVPAKGIARKGRSIADRRFWAGRGHYASQVSKKELKYDYEKGVFRGTVASGRAFIMEFKTNAYSIRWDEEGSPDIWRWNYYDIVAEVNGDGGRDGGGGGGSVGGGGGGGVIGSGSAA